MNIEQNAAKSDTTPTNWPRNSETSTSAKPTNSLIGTGLSTPGLETLRSLARTQNQVLDANKINTQLLASLKQDLGSRLGIKNRFDKDFEIVSTEVVITGEVDNSWIKALEHYTKPSSGEKVAMEVTRLRTLTAKRKEGEFDLELSIGAITEELQEYPEDIVRTVCRNWARNNKFFPVLKELIDECNQLMDFRKSALAAMREQRIIQFQKPDEKKINEEQKQKFSDMVNEAIKSIHSASS